MKGRGRKVTDAGVAEIREWYRVWKSIPRPKEMQRRFGIAKGTLDGICAGYVYKIPHRSGA